MRVKEKFSVIWKKQSSMSAVEEILKLSKAERIKIVELIWDSIAEEADDASLTPDQFDELRKRREEYEKGTMPLYTWEEVKLKTTREK